MQGKEQRWVYLFPVGLGLYERSQRKMRLHQILVAFDFTETLLVALCRLGPRLRNKWLVRQMTKSVTCTVRVVVCPSLGQRPRIPEHVDAHKCLVA